MNSTLNSASVSFFCSGLLNYTPGQVVYLKNGELNIRDQHWGLEWILRSSFVEWCKGVNSKAPDVKNAIIELSSRKLDVIDPSRKDIIKEKLNLLFNDLGIDNNANSALVNDVVLKLFPEEKKRTSSETSNGSVASSTVSASSEKKKKKPLETPKVKDGSNVSSAMSDTRAMEVSPSAIQEKPPESEKLLSYKEFRTRLLQTYPKDFVEEIIRKLKTNKWTIEEQMGSTKLESIEAYIKTSYAYSMGLLTSHEKFKELTSVLKTLDSEKNPHIQAKKALGILKELHKINPEFASLTENLTAALELLSKPNPFSLMNYVLGSFAQNLGGKFNKEGKENLIEASKISALNVIISHIKANIDDLPKLESNISKIVKDTKKEFLSVLMTMLHIPNQKSHVDLEKNIQRCIAYAEKIDQMFSGSYDFVVREFINDQNKRTDNRFDEILSELSYLDPRSTENESSTRKDVCVAVYKKLITPCIQALAKGDAPLWPESDILQENIDNLIGNELKAYIPGFEWIIKNYNKIKKVYNQFKDTDYNMEGGTCLYNSLDRIGELVKNPKLDMNMLEMRSSESGRVFAASLRHRAKIETETVNGNTQMIGYLKKKNLSKKADVVFYSSAEEAILEGLKVASIAKKPTNILFLLEGTGIGHAINIFIRENEIWIMDDNLGMMKFNSNKNDIKEIISCFEVLYSHYSRIGYSLVS